MVSALDEGERHVRAAESLEDLERMGERYIGIGVALQDADRAVAIQALS